VAKRRRQDTHEDCERAAALACDVLETVPRVQVGGEEMTGRYAAERARQNPPAKRRMAGRRLLTRFRRDTNCVGKIDWAKFHEWLKEHTAELTVLKILVSLISILLIL